MIEKIIHYYESQFRVRGNKKFMLSYDEELIFFQRFHEPKTDIEASYFQYKCQAVSTIGKRRLFFLNVLSTIILLPVIMAFFLFNLIPIRKANCKHAISEDILDEINWIPNNIINKSSCAVVKKSRGLLRKKDLQVILNIIINYPLSFFFILKSVWMIASYSFVIKYNKPKIIFSSCEYSFTSSILTMYCESNGIMHCNVQHGELFFMIRNAFSRFSKFYIRDKCYIDILNQLHLRMSSDNYIVFDVSYPKDLKVIKGEKVTYYLQAHSKEELIKIKSCLDVIGKEYKVRPHPLYNYSIIYTIFDNQRIENPFEISIWDSIANAGVVIAQYSAVLYQAYLLNVPIVIDDLSTPDVFKELKLRQYVMLQKPHKLLSELIA